MSRRAPVAVSTLLSLALTAGCASSAHIDPQQAADRLKTLTGADARVSGPASAELPAGVLLDDGLMPDEAVALALWNNAAFQVSVSELGFARADLLEAGMLTNPILSLLLPVGPKQFEAALRWPLEVLWQRPKRVAAAQLAADAAAERLVLVGLDLVASVRIAHEDLRFATDRHASLRESAALAMQIDTLTQSRLSAGDISGLEARSASTDLARASQDADRAEHDASIAQERLRLLLGLSTDAGVLTATVPTTPPATCGPASDLLKEALVSRPDIRAAEIGVEAAAAKLGWEKSRILSLTAVLDANGQGRDGFEMGPGLDISLPFFNRNQGARTRAEAELQRASAAYIAVQQQVALDIREATIQFTQAQQSLAAWRDTVMDPLEQGVANSETVFAAGETSRLVVLDHQRRLRDATLREREIDADVQRARAHIERAVGRSCGISSTTGAPGAPTQETSRDRQ
ncbi:MAG: TolC family protein [Acidobacteria bacterium]|nr:TolC family protein [Acidobacteriota bacterium]